MAGGNADESWFARHRTAIGASAAGLTLLVLFVVSRTIDVDSYLTTLREWVAGFGAWAPAAYALIFVAATLLAFPGTPFTIFAAFLFGVLEGFVVMVVATTLSASAGFWLSRTLLRETLTERFEGEEAFDELQALLEKDHWIVIPFVRLMPIFPFTFNNYALGLTGISFWRFLLWSELVMIPMNAVLVLGASALYRAMVRGEVSWWLIGGTVAAAALVLGLGALARRSLED